MDFFNSLWEDPAQREIPSAQNFAEDVSTEEWISQSSTFKLISGTFKHPHDWLGVDKYFQEGRKKLSNASTGKERKTDTFNKPKKEKKVEVKKSEHEESYEDSDDTESQAESSFHESHKYVPGLRKNPCNDKLSCMDNNEQAECLALFLKFSNLQGSGIMPSDRSEHFKFEIMYKKIQDEQVEFCQDALKQWPQTAKDSQYVPDIYMIPMRSIWMIKTNKALEFYPHIYKRRLMVPLLPANMKVEMVKMSDLLQMGRIPAFFNPTLKGRTKAQAGISKILISTQYNLPADQAVGSLHKLPVSYDPNAESLARLHKSQVVISSGALNTLLETYFDFSKSWTLPITVKEYRTIEKGKTTTKIIVFIDKPLPKQVMTAYECQRFILKHGVKVRLIQRKHQLCFTFPIPGVDPLTSESSAVPKVAPPDENVNDLSPESEEQASKKNQDPKNENFGGGSEADSADDTDDERLVIKDESLTSSKPSDATKPSRNENNQFEPTPHSSNISVASTNSSTVASANRKEPFKRKDGLKLPKTADGHTAPLSQANVTYSSWVIRPENDDQLSIHQKKALKELSVIVRSQVDACQRVEGEFAAISLSTKLEYQLEFAAEEPTKEELVREWSSLFFKPASHVVRTRVDAKDGEIIMCEKKDKFQIAADAQRFHGIRLSDSLQTLYSVFSEVSSLTKGSYLLHHSPEENAFASLEESVESARGDGKSVRNLADYFGQKLSVSFDPNLAWRKLDCNLVLPRHEILKTMPATYRPKPCAVFFKPRNIPGKQKNWDDQKRPKFPPKKKKKKNRNRNRKKQQNQPDAE